MKKVITFLFAVALFSCCNKSDWKTRSVDLKSYKFLKHDADSGAVMVRLLNVYRKRGDDSLSADLYVCTRVDRKDSMFVFGSRSISSGEVDKIRGSDFVILFDTTTNLKKVNVFVPLSFLIPQNIEYTFGHVEMIKE